MKETQQRPEIVSKLESLARHSNKFSKIEIIGPRLLDGYRVIMYAKHRFADAQEIEKYFRKRGIQFEWGPDGVNSDMFLPEDCLQPYEMDVGPGIYLTIGVPKNRKGK